MGIVSAVSSEKAIAGAAGGLAFLTAPYLSKVPVVGPFIGSPIGRTVGGAVIAFVAVKFLDGYTEAVVLGVGMGLMAQGVASFFLPEVMMATQ